MKERGSAMRRVHGSNNAEFGGLLRVRYPDAELRLRGFVVLSRQMGRVFFQVADQHLKAGLRLGTSDAQ